MSALIWKNQHVVDSHTPLSLYKMLQVALSQSSRIGFQGEKFGFASSLARAFYLGQTPSSISPVSAAGWHD